MKFKTPRFSFLKRFYRTETGAVTVDWVVLSAGVVLLVTSCLALVRSSLIGSIDVIFSWVANAGL